MVCDKIGLADDQSEHWQGKRSDGLQMVRTRRGSVAACIAVATDCASTACTFSAPAITMPEQKVNVCKL